VRILIRGAFASFGFATALTSVLTCAIAADLGAPDEPGGWTSVAAQDDQVMVTARFAVLEQARQSGSALKLLSIKHARHQFVAGSNISMNLMVLSEGRRRLAIAVVWIKPNGSMELTRWHWV
jgi:hypothetical protein